jgi:hypothetical protein
LRNQAERFFQDDNSTPTNQKELDQTRNTFVVTFVALVSLGHDKMFDKVVIGNIKLF